MWCCNMITVTPLLKIVAVKLGFEFRPGYPETETPIISILETTNLLEEDEEELLSLLKTEAKASLGMVMIFTLVSVASEWLNKRKDEDEKRKVEAIEKKKRDAEEMEMKRFEGTRVTVESFLKWKFSFDAEMAQVKSKTQQKESTASSRKLTGRELFEKDTTLYESDLAFLEEGDLTSGGVSLDDAGVTINDDLFDPDDDEDDDPDFDPNDAVDDD